MKRFKKTFEAFFPNFEGNLQQDAHEFLSLLLLSLSEDMNIAKLFNVRPDSVKPLTMEPVPQSVKSYTMQNDRD